MRRLIPVLLTLSLSLASCRGEPTAVAPHDTPSFARASGGGGGGTTTSTTITVTGASPAIARTDTVVDVVISGSGFAKGATARWAIGGDTTKVQVLSNAYVNSTTLKARIAIPAGAPIGSYDIVVTDVGGKKGIGAELFEIVLGDPNTDWYFPVGTAAPTVGLRSDGLYLDNGFSVYGHGVCGVTSKIFATTAASGSGDATMQTDNPNARDRKCAAYPRTLTIAYGDRTDRAPAFANVREVQSPTSSIPVGATQLRGLAINLSGSGHRCAQLRWNDVVQNGTMTVPADKLNVSRLSASTWLVKSRPYPHNRAYCMDNGAVYHLDVEFTIVSRTLPWLM
jgi:hypothetical protein